MPQKGWLALADVAAEHGQKLVAVGPRVVLHIVGAKPDFADSIAVVEAAQVAVDTVLAEEERQKGEAVDTELAVEAELQRAKVAGWPDVVVSAPAQPIAVVAVEVVEPTAVAEGLVLRCSIVVAWQHEALGLQVVVLERLWVQVQRPLGVAKQS